MPSLLQQGGAWHRMQLITDNSCVYQGSSLPSPMLLAQLPAPPTHAAWREAGVGYGFQTH